MNQSMTQWLNQSINESINQINFSYEINQSINQLINQSIEETSVMKTPSLQWNKCLWILWFYFQSSLALCALWPNLGQPVIWMLSACQLIKKKSLHYWQDERLLLPKLVRYNIPCGDLIPRRSQGPCLICKCGEGIFGQYKQFNFDL